MWSTAREIAEGDVVIVWLTRDAVQPLTITPGKELNGRFGNYRHSDLIGVPYGSKVASRNGKGFIHVLRPTPELWTLALPHRTQILYLADIAFITMWLGIRPGSRVVEAGTGSGSFTHSVARTIGPSGRLFSFEFHQSRADKAREEFEQHGMSSFVQLQHRNVCKDGFGIQNEVDAIFLDLPAPWEAVPWAKQAARKDRLVRICCFSPCMEQVLRTVSALNENGFTDVTMYETLLRPHEVGQPPEPVSLQAIREKLQLAEQNKEERRLLQIAASRAKKERSLQPKEDEDAPKTKEEDLQIPEQTAGKRKRETGEEEQAESGEGEPNGAKKGRTEDIGESKESISLPRTSNTDSKGRRKNSAGVRSSFIVTQPIKEVRGHTSYLTFACLLPSIIPEPGGSLLSNPDVPRQEAAQVSPEPQPTGEQTDAMIRDP